MSQPTTSKPIKIPGPEHPISIAYNPIRLRVTYQGRQIVDSTDVLTLIEANHGPVHYIPRADAAMDYLHATDHQTYCPYKGEASYFTLLMDGHFAENAVWSYEDPYPALALIKDRLAFYPQYVEMVEEPLKDSVLIAEVVEHTDSGAGRSQLEPWPANVSKAGS